MNNPIGMSINWQTRQRLSWIISTSEQQTWSRGAAQWSKSSQGKSGSDLPKIFPEIGPKTPHVAPIRKSIILKKIVPHAIVVPEVPAIHTLLRSFFDLFYLGRGKVLLSLKVLQHL